MVNHLEVCGEKRWFVLVRNPKLFASLLNDVLNIHIVGVANGGEEVVFNLVVEAAREVVPEPASDAPVDASLALDGGPVVHVSLVLHLLLCLLHGCGAIAADRLESDRPAMSGRARAREGLLIM